MDRIVLVVFLAFVVVTIIYGLLKAGIIAGFPVKQVKKPEITSMLLTVNEYSRPGIKLEKVNGVVVHYVANPGTTAEQNRDYFEGLKDTKDTYASSNFIIGLDGEIVECVPVNEVAYASNNRNEDTISIECCHPLEDGAFTEATYRSLVELTAYLCGEFNIKDEVIRHYDVTGKLCPLYYVDHPEKWEKFKEDVREYIKENGTQHFFKKKKEK